MSASAKKVIKSIGKLKPTDWQPATSAGLGAAAYQRHIDGKLDYFKFRNSAPIREIIGTPTDLYVACALSNSALLVALMANLYAYGRQKWSWVRGSPQGSQDPFEDAVKVHIASLGFPEQQRWKNGRGLLDGTVTSAVCGTFNSAFLFMAREIFDVPGVTCAQKEGQTMISDAFITMPGSQPIDGRWNGNVWYVPDAGDVAASRRSNEQIRALRFKGHYFANHGGTIYDVTANKTYKNTNEMIWCTMTENRAKAASFPGVRNVFDVKVVSQSGLANAGKYCIELGEEPTDKNRFSNYALTDREGLTANEIKTMSGWSSCS